MYHLPVVWAGTTLGASPPWVTMPWMRSVGRMCWRSRPIAVWRDGERVGRVDAELGERRRVRLLAVCSARRRATPRGTGSGPSPSGAGCTIIAAWTPSNAPRSSMKILPPPPSSAGVPITLTVMPRSSASGASARPAPAAAAAITLCPHAWPMPGSASYSAQIAIGERPGPGGGDEGGGQVAHAGVDGEAAVGQHRRPPTPTPSPPRSTARGWRGCGATAR